MLALEKCRATNGLMRDEKAIQKRRNQHSEISPRMASEQGELQTHV